MVTVGIPMPHRVAVLRPAFAEIEDGFGGSAETRTEIATGLEAFVQGLGPDEKIEYQKRGMAVDVKVYFLTEPPLQEGDIIRVDQNTVGASYVGQSFRFRAVDDATAGFGIAWKAICGRETDPVLPVVQ